MTEYHGWIVLRCTNPDWSNDEWDTARALLAGELSLLTPEDGHAIAFTETVNSMQTIFLHGYVDTPIEAVTSLFLFAAKAVPDSYGELLVLDEDRSDAFTAAQRYRLEAGTLVQQPK